MRLFGHRFSIAALIGLTIVVINLLGALLAPASRPTGNPRPSAMSGRRPAPNTGWASTISGATCSPGCSTGHARPYAIALVITCLSFAIGIAMGFSAAVVGGWIDTLMSRLVDTLMAIPTLILALIVLSVLGTSIPVLVGTIAVLDSTRVFRLSRAVGLNIAVIGLCRGGAAAGRGAALDRLARGAAQRPAAADRRIRPALLLRLPVHRLAQLPWPGHPAALCRLGRHGPRQRPGDQFRRHGAADPRHRHRAI